MLYPHSHTWTWRQRKLIVAAAIAALGAFLILVLVYEGHYRGPSESILFGTWTTDTLDGPDYLKLNADQTFRMALSPEADDETTFLWGRWYAGGSNLYLRFNADAVRDATRVIILPLVDVTQSRFSVRSPSGNNYEYHRIK